ncbi:hypothetical protein [Nitrosopumilus sp. b3]|uniref:hypothetical protein n=1 Tax=Nitrosopumilus sp. b3 TaxID=2109909 RepID=UPI0021023840|nr:hypothetical protein [Nitrosopumilus sp. b3]
MQVQRLENRLCSEFLSIDDSIRFVGILCKCGRLKAYDRKKGIIPQLTVPETKLVHREALLKAKMNKVFDGKLGKTNWSVESRGNVKWITVYHGKDLVLLSTEISSDHDTIVSRVQSILD